MSSWLEKRLAVDGRRFDRRRERRTEKISGSRSIKTGSWADRFDRAYRRESCPPDRRVETVVSNSLPPTLSLMRSPAAEAAGFRPFIDGGF